MRTLLIADDERTIREGIARSIRWESMGISRVILAADGKEAYMLIKKEQPDIAILDIIMPEMTGIEVISRLKNEEKKPEFIIISGYSEFDYAQEAIRHKVCDYILKPCDLTEIAETIKKVIAKIEEERRVREKQSHLKKYVALLEPWAQEQILRNYLTNNSVQSRELFTEVFHGCGQTFQLLLFSFVDPDHYSKLPALKRCIDRDQTIKRWKFSAILRDGVVLLFDAEGAPKVREAVKRICKAAARLSMTGLRAAVSAKGTLDQLPEMYQQIAEAIRLFFPQGAGVPLIDPSTCQYSKPVRQILQYVKENISNSKLSLNYIAANVLFLNPEYLGKLFKKECGMKFSDYLMTVRMEKAKQLMAVCDDLKMYEVARKVGLGENAAYFGQVFRKYTGLLPTEYKMKVKKPPAEIFPDEPSSITGQS